MTKCPVCSMWLIKRIAPSLEYKDETYYFMSLKHKATFEKDPKEFIGGREMHGGQDKRQQRGGVFSNASYRQPVRLWSPMP